MSSARDGRPIPVDARANDLAHWQTALTVADAAAAERALRGGACAMRSPGVIAPAERGLGFARALRLADPDGHGLALREP